MERLYPKLILDALSKVRYPGTGKDIVSSGMVADDIGYIGVSTFSEKTGKDFRNALTDLRKLNDDKELKGLIVDMRNNGGGLVTGAVDLVSNFVPRGTEVVSMKGRTRSNTSTYKTTRNPMAKSLPLVVLINGRLGHSDDYDRAFSPYTDTPCTR